MKPGAAGAATGACTRMEVASMLKIVTLCVGAALLQLLFTIVGYAGAPPVAKTDFTSQVTRCASGVEFTPHNVRACAATTNSTSAALVADRNLSNVEVVDALLQLRSNAEQAAMLSCLLDTCRNMTTRPVVVDDPETQLRTAHYAFGIDGLTQRNRYFYLEVALPNTHHASDSDWSMNVTLTPHVRGVEADEAYESNDTAALVDVLPPDRRRSLALRVVCRAGQLFCDPQYFLRFTEIDFARFRVDVLLNTTQPLPVNGRAPQFRKTWGNAAFTDWMLGIKSFFLVLAVLLTTAYARSLNRLRASEQTLEQNWVLALGVALVLYNDPFYALEAATGGASLRVLTVLFQATFFQMLLLFWLIALDNMRLQGLETGMSNETFFVPKIGFTVFFWLVQVAHHGFIKYYATNDPLWDPLDGNATFALLRALLALCSLTYLGWFLVLCVLSRDEVRAKRARFRALLALSLWMVLTCFLGLGAGSFSPTPVNGGAWTAYMALFNLYVFMLEYLYAPSAATLRSAVARNGNGTTDVNGNAKHDPEARPALAVSPLDGDDDVEVAGVELELA